MTFAHVVIVVVACVAFVALVNAQAKGLDQAHSIALNAFYVAIGEALSNQWFVLVRH
jgi:hypothetical protein